MSKYFTVQDLIDRLNKVEDKTLLVEVSTGHEDVGRFYGHLYRVSTAGDWRGHRIRLTG